MMRWMGMVGLLLACALALTACAVGNEAETVRDTPGATEAALASGTPQDAQAAVVPESSAVLPATVVDATGKRVTVKDVSRIVPLNGDIAEVVWALGLGDNVIATDTSATYPEAATRLPKIGYQRTLSAEGIVSLRPSLVIGNTNAGPPAALDQLRAAGVTVVIFEPPTTLEGSLSKVRNVAATLGVPNRGEALATRMQGEIDEARALAAKASGRPRVAFLYVRGATTQQLGGKGTAADALIAAAGGVDAGSAGGIGGFKPLTPEALVAAEPDVLLLLTAGLESVGGVDGLVGLPGVAQTPAGKNRRVLAYDDQLLLGLGPRVGQALKDLVLGLHPELR